jgi:hypothetical protein
MVRAPMPAVRVVAASATSPTEMFGRASRAARMLARRVAFVADHVMAPVVKPS